MNTPETSRLREAPMSKILVVTVLACALAASPGCSSSSESTPAPNVDTSGDAQSPPTGSFETINAWLAKGDYKAWHCEPEVHAARSPSPHGMNRICSNDASSAHGAGEYPVGAANVKELYDDTGKAIIGYDIAFHTSAGTTGANWYWYGYVSDPSAKVPSKDGVPGLVANGRGGTEGSPEQTICVACHAGAGSDATHAGHDFVYTQIMGR